MCCCFKIVRDVDVEKQEDLNNNTTTLDSPNNKK